MLIPAPSPELHLSTEGQSGSTDTVGRRLRQSTRSDPQYDSSADRNQKYRGTDDRNHFLQYPRAFLNR